jgi:hypothetical protein
VTKEGYVQLSFCKQTCEADGEDNDAESKIRCYKTASPYFDLVRGAVGDLVDGEHFFDVVIDDVVYEGSTTSLGGLTLSRGAPI